MNRIGLLALAAVAGLTLTGCVDREAQQQAVKTQQIINNETRPVTVLPVAQQALSETLQITGTVTTSEDVQIGAKIGGRLVAVYVKDGDPVKAGQVIAVQDTSDLQSRVRQAQAQVSSARSALDQARTNAEIAPAQSRAAIRSAEAQLRSARASYQKLRAGARTQERRQAEAAVNAAESAMNLAETELERTRRLVDEGAIPRARLDQAQNAYTAAVSQYQQALQSLRLVEEGARPEDLQVAQEQIRQAEEALRQAQAQQKLDAVLEDQVAAARANLNAAIANLDLAQQGLADAQIKAPFAGRISGNPAQAGTYLGPGTPVVRLVGAQGTYFEGEVPETLLPAIDTGKGVRVVVDALPGRTIYGSIVAISPAGEELGRIFKVRVQLGADVGEIKPGMFARGEIDLRTIPNAMVVPSRAVLGTGSDTYVFSVADGKAKRVDVQTGIRKGEVTQVTGLTVGQQVIVEGQDQVAEGTPVKIEEKKAPAVEKTASR